MTSGLKPTPNDFGRRVLNLSHDFICAVTFEGEFRYINPAMAAAVDFPAEELLATSFLSLVHSDDRMETRRKLRECLDGQSPDRFENRLVRRTARFSARNGASMRKRKGVSYSAWAAM